MKGRDVATIAFRLLAVWITVSAITAMIDLIFNWKAVAAQAAGSLSGVTNPPTERELLWLSASALVARGLAGVAVWWLAPFFARASAPAEAIATALRREDLYAAGSFLVGLYLVAVSVPALAFEVYAATRPGMPAYPEAHQQIPFLVAQLLLGLAFIRNQWLLRLSREDVPPEPSGEAAE